MNTRLNVSMTAVIRTTSAEAEVGADGRVTVSEVGVRGGRGRSVTIKAADWAEIVGRVSRVREAIAKAEAAFAIAAEDGEGGAAS